MQGIVLRLNYRDQGLSGSKSGKHVENSLSKAGFELLLYPNTEGVNCDRVLMYSSLSIKFRIYHIASLF